MSMVPPSRASIVVSPNHCSRSPGSVMADQTTSIGKGRRRSKFSTARSPSTVSRPLRSLIVTPRVCVAGVVRGHRDDRPSSGSGRSSRRLRPARRRVAHRSGAERRGEPRRDPLRVVPVGGAKPLAASGRKDLDEFACSALAVEECVEQRAPTRFGHRFKDIHGASIARYLYRCKQIHALPEMPLEEPRRVFGLEPRHLLMAARVDVQRLLLRGEGVEQRETGLARDVLVVPLAARTRSGW